MVVVQGLINLLHIFPAELTIGDVQVGQSYVFGDHLAKF
jgi:hypothetical protein